MANPLAYNPLEKIPAQGAYRPGAKPIDRNWLLSREPKYRFRALYEVTKSDQDNQRDSDAMDLIQNDIQAEKARVAELRARLANPAPEIPQPNQMNRAEGLGALIGGLITHRPDEAIHAGMGVANQRIGTKYENDSQRFQQEQALNKLDYSQAANNLGDLESRQAALGKQREQNIFDQSQNEQKAAQAVDMENLRSKHDYEQEVLKGNQAAELAGLKGKDAQRKAYTDALYKANTSGEAQIAVDGYNTWAQANGEQVLPPEVVKAYVGSAGEKEKNDAVSQFTKGLNDTLAKFGELSPEAEQYFNAQRNAIMAKYGIDPGPIPKGKTVAGQRLDLAQEQFDYRKTIGTLRGKSASTANSHAGRSEFVKALDTTITAAIKGFVQKGAEAPAVATAVEAVYRAELKLGPTHPAVKNAYARLKTIGVTPEMVKAWEKSQQEALPWAQGIMGGIQGQGEVKPMDPFGPGTITGPINNGAQVGAKPKPKPSPSSKYGGLPK